LTLSTEICKIIMRILHNIILLLVVLGFIGCTEELDSKPSSEEPTVSNFSLVYAIDEKPSGMKEATWKLLSRILRETQNQNC